MVFPLTLRTVRLCHLKMRELILLFLRDAVGRNLLRLTSTGWQPALWAQEGVAPCPDSFLRASTFFHMSVQKQSVCSSNLGSPAEDPSVLPRGFWSVLFNLEFTPAPPFGSFLPVAGASKHPNLLTQTASLIQLSCWMAFPTSWYYLMSLR